MIRLGWRWNAQLALAVLGFFGMPLLAIPLVMLFARSDPRRASIFPAWLEWANTWDDPGPDQGMYEPAVRRWYQLFGWHAKTWYWLGWRNQLYGLFHSLAPIVQDWNSVHQVGPDSSGRKFWAVLTGGRYYFEDRKPVLGGRWYLRYGYKVKDLWDLTQRPPGRGTDRDRPVWCLQLRRVK